MIRMVSFEGFSVTTDLPEEAENAIIILNARGKMIQEITEAHDSLFIIEDDEGEED